MVIHQGHIAPHQAAAADHTAEEENPEDLIQDLHQVLLQVLHRVVLPRVEVVLLPQVAVDRADVSLRQ